MTPVLECIIAVFVVVLIVVSVIVTVFLVKFLQEITQTMVALRELSDYAKKELDPIIKSLGNILATVNNVSTATNKQFELIKKILTTLLGASCVAFGSARKGGFISGFLNGFNIFKKKEIKNVNR